MNATVAQTMYFPSADEMAEHSDEAARVLKALANPNRLMVLCALVGGERSVSQINEEVSLSQSALSQHLARFRREGLVATRRESQTIYYRIADPKVLDLMAKLYQLYCGPA